MKIEDELYITNEVVMPNGSFIEAPSLESKGIEELIEELERPFNGDLVFNWADSEKVFQYVMNGKPTKTTIPLGVGLNDELDVIEYILRSFKLDIELSKYEKRTPIGFQGNNTIGGNQEIKKGIFCKFNSREENGEKLIRTARDTLLSIYELPKTNNAFPLDKATIKDLRV